MDFSRRVDELQQRVAATKATVQAAATESRDPAPAANRPGPAGRQGRPAAGTAAGRPGRRPRTQQVRPDEGRRRRQDGRRPGQDRQADQQLDAKAAATDADWAEAEAADALDFADWAVDNAQLVMLDAIDARAYADDLAKAAGS
jgi:hypothetical protein